MLNFFNATSPSLQPVTLSQRIFFPDFLGSAGGSALLSAAARNFFWSPFLLLEPLSIKLFVGLVNLLGDVLRGRLHRRSLLEEVRMPLLHELAIRAADLRRIGPGGEAEGAVIFVYVLAHADRAGARDHLIPLQSAQTAKGGGIYPRKAPCRISGTDLRKDRGRFRHPIPKRVSSPYNTPP